MPQGYDSPGVADNTGKPKKKKPPTQPPHTVSTRARRSGTQVYVPDTNDVARGARDAPGEVHTHRVVTDPAFQPVAPTQSDITSAINTRASQVPSDVADKHPGFVASVLVSSVPTANIQPLLASYADAVEYVAASTTAAGIPGALAPYYTRAMQIPDAATREKALSFIRAIAKAPESEQTLMLALLSGEGGEFGASEDTLAILRLIAPSMEGQLDDGSIIGQLAHATGSALMAVPEGLGAVGGAVLDVAQDVTHDIPVVAESIGGIHDAAGEAAHLAGAAGQFAISSALTTAAGLPLAAATGQLDPHLNRSIWDQAGDYYQSWDDVYNGGDNHYSGFTRALFRAGPGIEPEDDPGLADATELFGQIVGTEMAVGFFRAVKDARTIPESAGGRLSTEELLEMHRGGRLVADIGRTVEKATKVVGDDINALTERIRARYQLDPYFSRELALTKGDPIAIQRTLVENIDTIPEKRITTVEKQLRDLEGEMLDLRGIPGEPPYLPALEKTRNLIAERAQLQERLRRLRAATTVERFPTRHSITSAMRDAPVTRTEHLISGFYRGLRGAKLDLAKIYNDISPHDTFWNPTVQAGRPLEFAAEVSESMWRRMKVYGVDPEVAREFIGRYQDIKTDSQFFDYRSEYSRIIDAAMEAKGVPASWRLSVTQFSDATTVERARSLREVPATLENGGKTRVTRPVAEGPNGPLSTQPSEFIGHVGFEDVNAGFDAMRTTTKWDYKLRSNPSARVRKYYARARVPWEVVKFVGLKLPLAIWKPVWLVSRGLLGVVSPMGFKIILDENLRIAARGLNPLNKSGKLDLGGGVVVQADELLKKYFPKQVYDEKTGSWVVDYDKTVLGTIASDLTYFGDTRVDLVPTYRVDPHMRPDEAISIARGLQAEMTHLATDPIPFTQTLARFGPEGTLAYLTDHPDTMVGRWWNETGLPYIESYGLEPAQFLRDKYAQIERVTMGNPKYMEAIKTGRIQTELPVTTGTRLEREYRISELDDIRRDQVRARQEGDTIREREAAERYEEVTDYVESLPDGEVKTVDIGHTDAVVEEIMNDWREGRITSDPEATTGYKLPSDVRVTSHTMPAPDQLSRWDALSREMARANNWLYKGLGRLSRHDVALARGSMFEREFQRRYDRLISSGMAKSQAEKIAVYRAATTTNDIMYDLSARSSFDRATKELFWFAPAAREQLNIWLNVIPRESYWLPTMALRVGEVQSLLDGLHNIGLTRKNDKGELMLRIPGISTLVGYLTGGRGEFAADNFNPVTPAGNKVWPTITNPFVEATLDWSARGGKVLDWNIVPKDVRKVAEMFSKILTFDGDITKTSSIVPVSFIEGLRAIGFDIPWDQMNLTQWRTTNDIAKVRGLQFAMSKLADDGIMPPAPGSTKQEIEDYRSQLDMEAAQYRGWTGLVAALSQTVLPFSFRVHVPVVYDKFQAFKRREKIEYPYTDEMWDKINGYVADHPEAWPYAAGRFDQADHPILPDDAPFTEKLAQGDLKPYSTDDFFYRTIALRGLAAEESRLRGELKAAGLGSVEDQLRNRYDTTRIYYDHLLRMDKWLRQNSEIEDALNNLSSSFTPREELLLELSSDIKKAVAKGDLPQSFDVKAVQGLVSRALEDVDFGPAKTPAEQRMSDWYDKYYNPYNDKVGPLYDQLDEMFASGDRDAAFKTLDAIRRINDRWADKAGDASVKVTPEEYSFGNKSGRIQAALVAKYQARSPLYMTNFQMDKKEVGIASFEGRAKFLDELRGIEDEYYKRYSTTYAFDDKMALWSWREREMANAARDYGNGAQDIVRRVIDSPIENLERSGFAENNRAFWNIAAEAGRIGRFALANEYMPTGYAETVPVADKKAALYAKIDKLRSTDAAFDDAWRVLERKTSDAGTWHIGYELYDDILFGNTGQYGIVPGDIAAKQHFGG